jgi:hypothetical protein
MRGEYHRETLSLAAELATVRAPNINNLNPE